MKQWLDGLNREVKVLLRESDTCKWLTNEAAQSLENRAFSREAALGRIREAAIPELRVGTDQDVLKKILKPAEAEAQAQKKLATWLKGVSPPGAV